jgi:hypothetical protein
MCARLGDDSPAVGMANEDDRLASRVNGPPGYRDVVGERERRILDDTDVVAVVPLAGGRRPASQSRPQSAVNENDGPRCSFHDDLLPGLTGMLPG